MLYVNLVVFIEDEMDVVFALSDGLVKVWDAKTFECKCIFKLLLLVNLNKDDDEEIY